MRKTLLSILLVTLVCSVGLAQINQPGGSSSSTSSTSGFQTIALANMAAPTVVCTGSTGSNWAYKVAALDSNGELGGTKTGVAAFQTAASTATTVSCAATLNGSNFNTITWPATANATGYTVYRTTSGGTPANLSVVCDNTTALQCVDNGSVNTASVNPPVINSTGSLVQPICASNQMGNSFAGSWQIPGGGITNGIVGSGLCFDPSGNLVIYAPTHYPVAYIGNGWINKWSQPVGWSPNGTFPNSGAGLTMMGDTGNGFDSAPFMLDIGHNVINDSTDGYIASAGNVKTFTATAALTAGQCVKDDSANDNSVVVCVTTDTAAGVPMGIVLNSPGAAGLAYVLLSGTTALPVVGTGTCTRNQFVIVDTTTNGRIQCTGTYTAGTVIGKVVAGNAVAVGSTITMLLQPR